MPDNNAMDSQNASSQPALRAGTRGAETGRGTIHSAARTVAAAFVCGWRSFIGGWTAQLNSPRAAATALNDILKPLACIAALVTAFLFAHALYLDTKLSVYTDEAAYQLITARAGSDNFVYSNNPYPHDLFCGEQSRTSPLLWRPAQYLTWKTYVDVTNIRTFRLISTAKGLLLTALLVLLCILAMEGISIPKWETAALAVSALSLGILPFLLAYNRPEQGFVICLSWFILGPFIAMRKEPPFPKWVFAAAHIAALLAFFTLHAKTLLFGPVVLLSTFALFAKLWGRKAAIPAAIFVAVLGLQSHAAYSYCFRCPGSEGVARMNVGLYLAPQVKNIRELRDLAKGLAKNTERYRAYAREINFREHYYPADFMPPLRAKTVARLQWLNTFIQVIFCAMAIFPLLLVASYWMRRESLTSALADNGMRLLPLFIAATMAGLLAMQTSKPWYEPVWILPTWVMLAVISIRGLSQSSVAVALFRTLARLSVIAAACSLMALHNVFAARIENGYAGPNIDVTAVNPALTQDKVREAERACGIGHGPETKHLIVDDMTYMHYKRTYRPYLMNFYLWGATNAYTDDASDARVFAGLKNLGSDGIIGRCSYIDSFPVFGKHATRAGSICCLSKKTIEKLAGDYKPQCGGVKHVEIK